MRQPETETNGLPKQVICRFGSAYSTITVVLLDKKAYDAIQEKLNELEAANKLNPPHLASNKRVCFKRNDGVWLRAQVKAVHDDTESGETTVDIILEDTKEIVTCLKPGALVARPEDVLPQRRAATYFIEGLEPYSVIIVDGNEDSAVTAQRCADAMNELWTSRSRTALLKEASFPRGKLRAAVCARVFVASLIIEGNSNIRSFVESSLKRFFIRPFVARSPYYHQVSLPYVADSDGSSVLVPSVEYKEICEVVSLKKISAHSLRVGLRLQRYLDQELFFERLCGSAAKSDRVEMDINTAVAVISRGCYWQRGILFEPGKVLGVDTLDVIDIEEEGLEIAPLPRSLGDVFPHLGLFIDWKTSATAQTPCLGDYVLVTNLRPRTHTVELLQYLHDDVRVLNDSTVVGCFYDNSRREELLGLGKKPPPTDEQKQRQGEMLEEDDERPLTLADWYGLSPAVEPFLTVVGELNLDKLWTGRAFLEEFGETARMEDL